MTLTNSDILNLVALRHDLHRHPEVSGNEARTAQRIVQEFAPLSPDTLITDLGGHGVAVVFDGSEDGPTVLFRCELDALPIYETGTPAHRSHIEGVGHLCGHDGHMAILMGLARLLSRQRPARGRVVLLFQPAEETGAGARAVLEDPRWPELRPDFAFAYHNVPGHPLGEIGLRPGPGNCASRGMQILLRGKSSHAAVPEDGLSPAAAMAGLMVALPRLSQGTIGAADFALATLTHACLGAPTFGIAPADGELRVTLRTMTNARMDAMIAQAQALVEDATDDLQVEVHWHDVFRAVVNDAEATAVVRDAALAGGHDIADLSRPMRWSEDFGLIGDDGARAALLYVGAGTDRPQLHNPDYDFPDALIPIVTDLLSGVVDRILGPAPA